MNVVALVPARGGSKGVRRKNVQDVAGRPLIGWTIAAALASGVVDRTIVSTDDEEIARVAAACGAEVPFTRPSDLSGDEATAAEVGIHALDWLASTGVTPDWLLLLQPTSPLRSAEDIRAAVGLAGAGVDAVVAVRAVRDHPAWLVEVGDGGMLRSWAGSTAARRQDEPALHVPNGAVYLVRPDVLRTDRRWYGSRTVAYIMPEERSLDVDTPWDLRLASLVLSQQAPTNATHDCTP